MESITIKDVIQSASGRNKDGFTKSAVGLFFEKVDGEGEVRESVDSVTCDKAVIEASRGYRYIFIDLIFSTKLDTDLLLMNKLLNQAFSAVNSMDDSEESFPLVSLSIVPHEYGGTYYLLCTDPAFWSLTAQDPKGEINTIRLVFAEDDVYLFEADKETLTEIESDIAAEMEAEARKEEFYREQAEERSSRISG